MPALSNLGGFFAFWSIKNGSNQNITRHLGGRQSHYQQALFKNFS